MKRLISIDTSEAKYEALLAFLKSSFIYMINCTLSSSCNNLKEFAKFPTEIQAKKRETTKYGGIVQFHVYCHGVCFFLLGVCVCVFDFILCRLSLRLFRMAG